MAGRRSISLEELREILADHERWLASDGRKGRRACLHDTDLTEAKLAGASLRQADLRNADLRAADLTGASLEESDLGGAVLHDADLIDASLHGANLSKTSFRDANLTNADLQGARGLAADSFACANLTNAKLPAEITRMTLLDHAEAAHRSARTFLILLIVASGYSLSVVVSATDKALIVNEPTPMPYVGIETPISPFFYFIPFFIPIVQVSYLSIIRDFTTSICSLPHIMTDGVDVAKSAYFWPFEFLFDLRLKQPRQATSRLFLGLNFASILLAPATMIALWWRYLPRHDLAGTVWHVILLCFALFVGAVLFWLMVLTLRREIGPLESPGRRKIRPVFAIARQPRFFVAPAAVFFLFIIPVSAGVFYGDADRFTHCIQVDAKLRSLIKEPCIKKAIPNFLKSVGYRAYAELRDEEISRRPATWSDEEELFRAVRGADLEGQDLRYADARGTFFVKAILDSADLEKADLRGADLRRARLIDANLEGAHLEDADLGRAVLVGAKLKGAFLNRAKLQEANLLGADLTNADLRGANLAGAVRLTREHLEAACGDENTILPDEFSGYQFNSCPKGDA